MAPLVDPFGRTVRDLRISITDRCNFRCQYCMPEEGMVWQPRDELLSFEEIERVARVCVERFGFDSIRLTGGEPTVRAHLPVLVETLARLGTVEGGPRRRGGGGQRRRVSPGGRASGVGAGGGVALSGWKRAGRRHQQRHRTFLRELRPGAADGRRQVPQLLVRGPRDRPAVDPAQWRFRRARGG